MQITEIKVSDLKEYQNNPRENDKSVPFVANSIKQFGFKVPIIIDKDNVIIAGHTRLKAAKSLGIKYVPCIKADDLTPEQVKAFRLADNKVGEFSQWDINKLDEELSGIFDLNMQDFGFSVSDIVDHIDAPDVDSCETPKQSLKERFLMPPTSILNARSGEWQDRKRQWIDFGIKSEESRENMKAIGSAVGSIPNYYILKSKCEKNIGRNLSYKEFDEKYLNDYVSKNSNLKRTSNGGILSVFDPVLCELMYYWFSFEEAKVLDPFAGGSVRGIVAAMCKNNYFGCDLRQEQINANIENAKEVLQDHLPTYYCGNSLDIDKIAPGEYDFVFSCPPYFDLEKYSDDSRDLSNQTYPEFLRQYREIISKCVGMLKENRFAVFVVGDVRDKKTGVYRGFVADTISAFKDAGANLYNEIILVTPLGSVPVIAAHYFKVSRKVGKTHQNVLVFFKGDHRKIKEIYKEVNVVELGESE